MLTLTLTQMLAEVHAELLDDCGDWNMPMHAAEIVNKAAEEEGDFNYQQAMDIVANFPNIIK